MNMMVTPMAPPPGSTSIGDLYVDLQSRTMWLGVDAAVDPAGVVLLSDIVGTDAAIETALFDANAYTDDAMATRAPTVHTHTASQITDFNAAVTAVVGPSSGKFTRGMIISYFGSLANIGVGDLAGWALCDGSNGTPNLRDRFIIGAGNRAGGIANTATKVTTDTKGSHVHTIGGTALTVAQMPSHAHTVTVSGGGTFATDARGDHGHTSTAVGSGGGTPGLTYDADGGFVGGFATSTAGNHAHNVTVSFASAGTTAAQGSSTTHTHTCTNQGDHSHDITQLNLREAIPYLTLAFIMKL